jgi:hypothetical protein
LQNSEICKQMGVINLDRRESFDPLGWASSSPHPLTWRRITAGDDDEPT